MKHLKWITASFCLTLLTLAARGQAIPDMKRSMQFVNFDKPAAVPTSKATAANTAAGNTQTTSGTSAASQKDETRSEATKEN